MLAMADARGEHREGTDNGLLLLLQLDMELGSSQGARVPGRARTSTDAGITVGSRCRNEGRRLGNLRGTTRLVDSLLVRREDEGVLVAVALVAVAAIERTPGTIHQVGRTRRRGNGIEIGHRDVVTLCCGREFCGGG